MLPLHQGTLVSGLIINKPTKMSVNSLFPQSRPLKNKSQTVYFGGPVDPTQYSLIFHSTQPPEAATRLFQDVYLSVDADYIARVLKGQQPVEEARLFAGRAQWTSGQLEGEMLRESWRDVPADPNLVFSQNPGGLWKVLVERSQWQEVSATGGQFGRTLGPKL